MNFQNIYAFIIYQKTLLHTLLLLVFEFVQRILCILNQTVGKKCYGTSNCLLACAMK